MSHRLALAALATLLLAGCGGGHYAGSAMQPSLLAPDVALEGAGGTHVSFARTGGRITLATFGYTSCPDVCPTTLSKWRTIHHALGADTAHVRFVFVSGDWRHDTPARTAEFAHVFDASFIGVTADSASIHHVLPAFQAEVGYGGPPGSKTSGFAHSDFNYVIDDAGRIELWYPFGTAPEAVASDLRRMLLQRGIVRG